MNYRLSKKDVIENNSLVISAGYCQMQFLLQYKERLGFISSKNYGHESDVFLIKTEFPRVAISTGYHPIGVPFIYDVVSKYEKKAEKLVHDSKLKHEEKKEKVNKLLNQFIKYALKELDIGYPPCKYYSYGKEHYNPNSK